MKAYSGHCFYCGRQFDKSNPLLRRTRDHIIPVSHGGINNTRNYVNACKKCNGFKGNRTPDELANYIKTLDEKKTKKWGAEYLIIVLVNTNELILEIASYRHTLYKNNVIPDPLPEIDNIPSPPTLSLRNAPPEKVISILAEDWQQRFNKHQK